MREIMDIEETNRILYEMGEKVKELFIKFRDYISNNMKKNEDIEFGFK